MLLKCDQCDKEFDKRNAEYNRRIKKNPDTKFFCTRSCSVSNSNSVRTPAKNMLLNFKGRNKLDEYSPFRYFLIKARGRKHDYNIDLPYLKELWEQQQGLCAISGIQMALAPSVQRWQEDAGNPWKPSLDRIDSSVGYMKDNVQFVCMIANLAKSTWTNETVIEFCKKTAGHHTT